MEPLKLNQEAFLYKWSDKTNNMLYIGSHKGDPDDGYICSSKLMMAEYNKRSKDFIREVLCIGEDSYIRELENKLLSKVDAANNSEYYNQINIHPNFCMSGREHTKETKKKISISLKGHKLSIETIAKRTQKQSGKNHWNYGKHHSEESKKKMSDSHIGYKLSAERIEKIKKRMLKFKHSKKSKEKISLANRGSKNGQAKLDEEKVILLRKYYNSNKYSKIELALIYNVSPFTIIKVVKYKTWKHI